MSRHIVITGASAGIGAATARRLHGTDRLSLGARRVERLADVVPDAFHHPLDVTDEASVEAFLDEQAPFVWSWAWRYVARRGADEQAGAADDRARIEELTPLLLAALKLDLEREGVTWFVVLFQGDSLLTPEGREDAWEHDFLARTLRELGIPYVSMRRELIEHATKPGASPKQLFIQGGPGAGHYSAAGNAAVFPALLRGLRGEFD